ncbi:MAG: amidohydrolase family protein [Pirellulaceae bacterium]
MAMDENSVTRRTFLAGTAAAVTLAASSEARPPRAGAEQPALQEATASSTKPKVIDCHAHLRHHASRNWEEDDRLLIEAADILGIDQLCCSILTPRRPATAEGFRECNQWVWEAMQRFPGRVLGYCYVNPGTGHDALDEAKRCIEERGFMGIKLYNEHKCTEPVVFPLMELAIELRIPVLHHAGHINYPLPDQPRISDGGDFAELATRYPELMLICAHVCGGGDWEWTIKALRKAPSVFLDTSGSVTDAGVMELALEVLGPERLVFGCDMSLTAGVGRMRAAELSAENKARIMGGNLTQLLARRNG